VICPTGEVCEFLSSPCAKNKLLFKIPKSVISSCHTVPQEGRSRSSRTLGWDAVEAAASGAIVSQGEFKLVSGAKCAGRTALDADGEVVWS
jgi:hypothetical protein